MEDFYLKRRFKPTSKLHRYLAYQCPGFVHISKKDYSLYELLLALKKVIHSNKLFDPHNPFIIMCDALLEDALEVKYFHTSDVSEFVLKQLEAPSTPSTDASSTSTPSTDAPSTSTPSTDAPSTSTPATPAVTIVQIPAWASMAANAVVAVQKMANQSFDIEGYYTLTPGFLDIIRSMDGVPQDKTVFHYRELTLLLSQYIMAKKDTLFDLRNVRVCYVENDPLGKVFGVKAFGRRQVTALLRTQLEPATPPPLQPPASPQPSASQQPLASQPVAQSPTPESSSQPATCCSQPGPSSAPCACEAQQIPAEEDSSSSGEEYTNTYRGEYEPIEPIDVPKPSDGSDDDSDIQHVQVQPINNASDAGHLADAECDTMAVDSQLPIQSNTKSCFTCKTLVPSFARYCSVCWTRRKFWIPIHKRRSKSQTHPAKKQKMESFDTLDGNLCTLCYIRPKDAAFIHGQCSHQLCCYPCAKKLVKDKKPCPVCRRKIEKITKHFVY